VGGERGGRLLVQESGSAFEGVGGLANCSESAHTSVTAQLVNCYKIGKLPVEKFQRIRDPPLSPSF
jgi:hypothetical protein